MISLQPFPGLWVIRDLQCSSYYRSFLDLTGVAFYDDMKEWHVPLFTKPDVAALFRDVVCKKLNLPAADLVTHHIKTLAELRDILFGLLTVDRVLIRIDEDDPARIDAFLQQVVDLL